MQEITLFNKKYNTQLKKDEYHKTYLDGVYVEYTKNVNVIKSGMQNSNDGMVIIPEDVETDKLYCKPAKYQDAKMFWTLQEEDIIVEGHVDIEITDDYRIANLKKEYDNVYIITSVLDNRKGSIPHFEVGVK